MKKNFSSEAHQRILDLLEQVNRVERVRALEILREAQQHLAETDYSENPDNKISILVSVARYHVNDRNPTSAYKVLQEAQKCAEESNLPQQVRHIQSLIAIVYSMRGDHLKAIYTWEDMLSEFDSSDEMWIPIVNNLTVAYSYTKQFTRAVDLGFELIEALDQQENDDPDLRISAWINLGNAYGPLKSNAKAINAYKKALDIAEQSQNIPYQSYIHGNMARTYSEIKEYDKAYEHATKALEITKSYYGESQLADSLSALGSICNKMKRYDEAKELLQSALEHIDSQNDTVCYTSTLLSLCTMYLEQNQPEKCLDYLTEAEKLCHESDIQQHKVNLYKLWNEYYSQIGDYAGANKRLLDLGSIYEEQYQELSDKMISKQEADYLSRKIEKNNEILQKKNTELEESNNLIIRQSKQLEKSNRELHASLGMLNRLISIISHDVRGPAANSAAALRMIQEGKIGSEAASDLIGNVIDNLDSVTDLLSEMMIWIESRNFSKEVDRLMKAVPLCYLLDPVLKFHHGHIKQKNIDVEHCCSISEYSIYTEPNIMKIVLRNILSNAIKFTASGGKIKIFCTKVKNYAYLNISDNGVGMSTEEIDNLMRDNLKPKAGTNKEIGMGMGLHLCLSYLKLLKVEYEIHSELNKGTQFILKLRIADR
ncbi:MAG: tetratricopeptide repeat protein [Candidatus Cloacimonetes bacterium]|nr:tetratricopeptide repeat protein [Candidatus Cloacimonadota bacterium]